MDRIAYEESVSSRTSTYCRIGSSLAQSFRGRSLTCATFRKFEEWLKEKDAAYGLRNLEEMVDLGELNDLELVEKIEMPANNLSLIFRKVASES